MRIFSSKSKLKILKEHLYFKHIDDLLNNIVPTLEFGDEAKNYLIKLFMTYKLTEFKETILDIINNKKLYYQNPDKLSRIISDKLLSGFYHTLENFKIKEGKTEEDCEVIDMIIERYWTVYHRPMSSFVAKEIKEIYTTKTYKDNYIRMYTTLFIILLLIDIWVKKAVLGFYNINGDFKGKKIHGYEFK